MLKVIIFGGRDFDNYPLLEEKCDKILSRYAGAEIEIVSGKQATYDKENDRYYGADYLGEQYALKRGYPVAPFPADWDRLGLPAGPIRNDQMAQYGACAIGFWDGKSKGTKNMIDLAISYKLILRVIRY